MALEPSPFDSEPEIGTPRHVRESCGEVPNLVSLAPSANAR
jgi:hypothetical protein